MWSASLQSLLGILYSSIVAIRAPRFALVTPSCGGPGADREGVSQNRDGAGFLLVWHDVDAGDARVIVDGDAREFPADAARAALSAPVTGNAMAGPAEFSKLFDVEMDHLAGRFTFVARAWFARFDGRQQAEAALGEDARDGRGREAEPACDEALRVALAAQDFGGVACGERDLARR